MKHGFRNIILLGWVSLFTDLSSQMIYPLLPKFLVGLGAGAIVIGLIEGIAEASASLFKPISGLISDKKGKSKQLVFFGYSLSALTKPILAISSGWFAVLFLRFGDRLGKAIRNPPRDAIISFSSEDKDKGYNFGVQRAFDRIGSIGGPFLALLVLYFFPENLRAVFLFAFIPAIIGLWFIRKIKVVKPIKKEVTESSGLASQKAFRIFIIANVFFSLGNSSNAFILLKADEIGFSLLMLPMAWALYNLTSAISSPIMGRLSDNIGRAKIIYLSFIFYAVIYMAFAFVSTIPTMWALFALYGIHYGLSKGVYKAYISDITSASQRGYAFGIFDMWTGISLFIASLLMGIIWELQGSFYGFVVGAIFSLLALLIFLIGQRQERIASPQSH